MKKTSSRTIFSNLSVYGMMHAVVDAMCAGVVFSIFKDQLVSAQDFFNLVILYNVLAFGLQALWGFITDRFDIPRTSAIFGAILVGMAAISFSYAPIAAVILAGLGNAIFHVGAGVICLNLTPKKASAPGVYVAPGALGLFVGTILGKGGNFVAWPFLAILTFLIFLTSVITRPEIDHDQKKEVRINGLEWILSLVFVSVVIRSLVGMSIILPWRTDLSMGIALVVAIVLGKGLGGIFADRFGWLKVGVGTLALSIPLLVFGANNPYVAIIGMFLFNMTMPITLIIISNIFPGRTGFAFGLTCFALLLGAVPSFFVEFREVLGNQWMILSAIIVSIVSLYISLKIYYKDKYLQGL
ncbi:MAG: hypothetical protein PHW52_02630 [Candidatus Pacebacteria bacterium]|nr:hypothetical protein [Candidatus Paceibacterota bacterium]